MPSNLFLHTPQGNGYLDKLFDAFEKMPVSELFDFDKVRAQIDVDELRKAASFFDGSEE